MKAPGFAAGLALCGGALWLFISAPALRAGGPAYFAPSHRIEGIGVSRLGMSDLQIEERTSRMIESQTFTILRDPQATAGAERITSPKLQALFRKAAAHSGIPASLLEAISYLESWGNPRAESPSGPRGIMQISEGTARRIGLRVVHGKRYRVTRVRVLVKRRHGQARWRTVRRRTPYWVTVRDDRLRPERAIPAAARYLAQLEQRFGGRDWAIWAYHCGERCVAEVRDMARDAKGISGADLTVARVFFSCSPVYNQALYEDLRRQMERDYSPTYWFRVMRAQQLLALYREDPQSFRSMAREYRYEPDPAARAPHRLSVWLRGSDVVYRTADDLRASPAGELAAALDDPPFFGYTLPPAGPEGRFGWERRDTPAALGTLLYVAWETRRLFDAMTFGQTGFVPLPVTSLVRPASDGAGPAGAKTEFASHATGQVFDIDTGRLPAEERQALRFVLDDLGWGGHLGFVEESPGSAILHIGCAPASREFFSHVFEDALAALPPTVSSSEQTDAEGEGGGR